MKEVEMESVILKLRGAKTLVNAMASVPGSYDINDKVSACFIIEDAIQAVIDELNAAMEN